MVDKRIFKKVYFNDQVEGFVVELAEDSIYMFKLVEYYKNENREYVSNTCKEFSLAPTDFNNQENFKGALRKEFPSPVDYKGHLYVAYDVIRYYKSVR